MLLSFGIFVLWISTFVHLIQPSDGQHVLKVNVAPFPPYNYPCNNTRKKIPDHRLYFHDGTRCQNRDIGIDHEFCSYIFAVNKIPYSYTFHDFGHEWGNVGGPNCSALTGLLKKTITNETFMCVSFIITQGRLHCGLPFSYPVVHLADKYAPSGIIMRKLGMISADVVNPFVLTETLSLSVWLSIAGIAVLCFLVCFGKAVCVFNIHQWSSGNNSMEEMHVKLPENHRNQLHLSLSENPPTALAFLVFLTATLFESSLLQILLLRKMEEPIRSVENLISRLNNKNYRMVLADETKDYRFELGVRYERHGLLWKLNQSLTENKLKRVKTTSEALDYVQTHEKHVLVVASYINGSTFFTAVINGFMSTSQISDIWKKSTTVPLLKPGKDPSAAKPYRPVSLLCPAIKVMERLILPILGEHLPEADFQHGFRAKHSTTSGLLDLNTAIAQGFNQKKPTGRTLLLQLDLTKAFDMVNHDLLLTDLNNSTC